MEKLRRLPMQLTAFRRRVSNRYISHAVTATPSLRPLAPHRTSLWFSHAGTHTMTFFSLRQRNFTNFQSCKNCSYFFFNFFKPPLFTNCIWHFYGFCFALFFRLPAALKLFFNYFISRARYTKPNQTKSEKKTRKWNVRKSLLQTCWHKFIRQPL